uniref:Uncharacterized protein n=1 Tax=viral metagenome TaxID=1070528 RepID=A0A6C0ED00_9ZZZZ
MDDNIVIATLWDTTCVYHESELLLKKAAVEIDKHGNSYDIYFVYILNLGNMSEKDFKEMEIYCDEMTEQKHKEKYNGEKLHLFELFCNSIETGCVLIGYICLPQNN